MKFREYFRSELLAEFVFSIENIKAEADLEAQKHSLKSMGADDPTSY